MGSTLEEVLGRARGTELRIGSSSLIRGSLRQDPTRIGDLRLGIGPSVNKLFVSCKSGILLSSSGSAFG